MRKKGEDNVYNRYNKVLLIKLFGYTLEDLIHSIQGSGLDLE